MKKIALDLFCTLAGIGSSSGIFYQGENLFLLSDNASWLYAYHLELQSLKQIPLFDAAITENIPKKQKPDLEALSYADGALYAFGSGSTPNRNRGFRWQPETGALQELALAGLYEKMQQLSGIDQANFNIEGAFKTNGHWYFFQRGNGAAARNGFFRFSGSWENPAGLRFTQVVLPTINNFSSGFTDATWADEKCYFLASAEDSGSTFEDGAVAGSALGVLDLESGRVIDFLVISDTHKFEGLTLRDQQQVSLSFLLCEDNDSDVLRSDIYELKISR